MIIVKLMGGLGNQLFQYAFGRALSIEKGDKLKFDLTAYSKQGKKEFITPRTYALDQFNLTDFKFASENEIMKFKTIRRYNFFGSFQAKINNYRFKTVEETAFNFHKVSNLKGKNFYFEGYWQTEKYFKHVENVVRREFVLKEAFSIEDLPITKEVRSCNSISLHIRRGDYVTSSDTNNFHGVCSLEYYAKAVDLISQKISKPIFYVFSDDIDWARQNIKVDFETKFIADLNLKDCQEMMLMSYCKHNITANSSFSWWGAWLNQNKNKMVVVPFNWFANKELDTTDLIPKGWHKIKTALMVGK